MTVGYVTVGRLPFSHKYDLNAHIYLSERKIHVSALCCGKKGIKEYKKDDFIRVILN